MSICISYGRILEIYEDINAVALANNWKPIISEDMESMRLICDLLLPLSDVLRAFEGDGLTISSVYNSIHKLVKYYKASAYPFNTLFCHFRRRRWILQSSHMPKSWSNSSSIDFLT